MSAEAVLNMSKILNEFYKFFEIEMKIETPDEGGYFNVAEPTNLYSFFIFLMQAQITESRATNFAFIMWYNCTQLKFI